MNANGKLKKGEWKKFLDSLEGKKKKNVDCNKELQRMKIAGLPIEEK